MVWIIAAIELGIEPVDRPHHRMAEAVGRGGKLDRHISLIAHLIKMQARFVLPDRFVLAQVREDFLHHFGPAELDEKVIHHDPLVVPAHQLLHFGKRRFGHLVDELVVELKHRTVQLRDDHILVIAFVADQGALGRARVFGVVKARQIA